MNAPAVWAQHHPCARAAPPALRSAILVYLSFRRLNTMPEEQDETNIPPPAYSRPAVRQARRATTMKMAGAAAAAAAARSVREPFVRAMAPVFANDPVHRALLPSCTKPKTERHEAISGGG